MRTTVTIDDDVLAAARALAAAEGLSLGGALSRLARRGLSTDAKRPAGFPVFDVPPGARPITLADVQAALDEP